ncbi:hypothetical protein RD792_006415, partial [Penstemon davidsonii]
FTPNDLDRIYEQSAHPWNNAIRLAQYSDISAAIGRATYAQPLYLWDKASGNLTNFNISFTFLASSYLGSGGIAFFLAPNGSRIPENTTTGGSMGLTSDSNPLNSTNNPFVAVEFDVFSDYWDPLNEHVGIDINSMRSVANVTWLNYVRILEGGLVDVWISYDSQSKNLSLHRISAAGSILSMHTIYSWSHFSRKNKKAVVIGLVVGGWVSLGLVGLLVYYCLNNRNRTMNEIEDTFDVSVDDEFEQGIGPQKFAYKEPIIATNSFSDQEKLGEGGFGGVYKGFINRINSYVAVKRVSSNSRQGIKEFASEVKIISRLKHRNLVQLLGWCNEKKELVLVYEFMPNGSLDYHLFKGRSLLDWGKRFKIVQGLASSLLYLHEEWVQCVVHRDYNGNE